MLNNAIDALHITLLCLILSIVIMTLLFALFFVVSKFRRQREKLRRELAEKTLEVEMHKDTVVSQNDYLEIQKDRIVTINAELDKQTQVVAEIQRELNDSINYANVIQRAAIPSDSTMYRIFGDNLVIFHPLNAVSGDFYWALQAGPYKVLAVGDCTGHGIPGAFLSMLGMSILDIVVPKNLHGNISAGAILDEMRTNFNSVLTQDSRDNFDGIDMAIVIVDPLNNLMHCAGAMRPVIHVHNDVLDKIDADRMPIGPHIRGTEHFTDHVVDLSPGDVIYLYTDGMTDQFGYDIGNRIHKFTSRRFRDILHNVHKMPFSTQKMKIEMELSNWRMDSITKNGDIFAQTDDALLVGIRA